MTATTFLLLIATVLNVEGTVARIDRGHLAGLRVGDVGTFFYELKVDSETRRVEIGTGSVIDVAAASASIRTPPETTVQRAYRVAFEIAVPPRAGQALLNQVRSAPSGTHSAVTPVPQRPAPNQPTDESVRAFVTRWAEAWSDQRVDDYLALYASNFRAPAGTRRREWAAQRRQRISAPRSISVQVEQLEVISVASRVAVATFVQVYRSDTFEDRVPKLLDLVREAGEWRILEERLVD